MLLVSHFSEPDAWIDAWEARGVVIFTGRDVAQTFRDAFEAAELNDMSVDDVLEVHGFKRLDE